MEVYATKQEENCRAERGVGGGVQQNNLESCRAIVYIGRVLIPQYIIFTLFLIPSSSVNVYSRYYVPARAHRAQAPITCYFY